MPAELPDREAERLTLLYDVTAKLADDVLSEANTGKTSTLDQARVIVELSREIRLSQQQVFSQGMQERRLELAERTASEATNGGSEDG